MLVGYAATTIVRRDMQQPLSSEGIINYKKRVKILDSEYNVLHY